MYCERAKIEDGQTVLVSLLEKNKYWWFSNEKLKTVNVGWSYYDN